MIEPLPFKPSQVPGFSEKMLASHYENNYGGAARRLAAISSELTALDLAKAPAFKINGLKREEIIAANSVFLHELYFHSLGGDGTIGKEQTTLAQALEESFGSWDSWRTEFAALGKALAGGSGWVVLHWSACRDRLVNVWAADHTHNLAGGIPLLALDMYEHAYHMDFGANAGAYVDCFMRNISWKRASVLFTNRPVEPEILLNHEIPAHELVRCQEKGRAPLILDVRLRQDYEAAKDKIARALWRDPMRVADWITDLPPEQPILVYCAYGFAVGRNVAETLREHGFDASILSGGIAAWHAIGGPTENISR